MVKRTEYNYGDDNLSGAKIVKGSPHNHTTAPPQFADGGMRKGGKVDCAYADGGAVSEAPGGVASPGSGGRLTTADVTEKPTYMGAVKDRISSMLPKLPDLSGHSPSTPPAGRWGVQRTDATLKEADRQSE